MLRLHDTALGLAAPLVPREEGRVSLYVCGPTVDNDPHVGHGRFTVTWDVLRRYLGWCGFDVRFVSNVTDIDDKIIARAASERRSPEEVAAHYEAQWWETQDRLGVARPDATPHATAYVQQMIDLIGELVERGHAYAGGDGVYFASESVEGYGLLARQPIESLRAGARVEAAEGAGKRAPIDFALWKAAKPGEPRWESPWGAGRPGWHTECVVMALDLLGDGFDLHAGGLDLAFPHHENERAQAGGAGRGFARRWAHNGMIVDKGGEKMSKSLGNTLSLADLLTAHGPRAFRLQVLQSQYRSPMTMGDATLSAAAGGVQRLDAFAREFAAARGAQADAGALARLRERMDDDLDTPGAVAAAFDLVRRARSASGEESANMAAAVFSFFEGALGLVLHDDAGGVTPEAAALARERDAARAERDWSRADAIRTSLQAEGWIVEDGPGGTTIRR
ncbi:MAG: cysteine--tRNA ligase [Acidimicrobiales bacterium]